MKIDDETVKFGLLGAEHIMGKQGSLGGGYYIMRR
jgi:hypothetical protein